MGVMQDVKYGIRMLARTPVATLVAILSLALGIAANSVIFSVVDALGLRPLAIRDAPGLMRVFTSDEDSQQDDVSFPDLRDLRERNRVFSDVAAYARRGASVSQHGGMPELVLVGVVTGNYFPLLGVRPAAGRLFVPSDESESQTQASIVISDGFWERRFARDPRVLGTTIDVDRKPATIIGVLPSSFNGLDPQVSPAFWLTNSMWKQLLPQAAAMLDDRRARSVGVLARRRPGVSLQQVQADVSRIGKELARQYPATNAQASLVADFDTAIRSGRLGVFRVFLMGIVGLVLLIACANVAGLLLGRAEARRREIGMRVALGASRGRLVRQMLTESVLLSVAAGVAGLVLTAWFLHLIPGLLPNVGLPLGFEFPLDGRVLACAVVATLVTVPVFGLLPALVASRFGVAALIRSRGSERRHGRLRWGSRDVLVVGQIALSSVLLISAGLLVRSYVNSQNINPGFEPRPMVIATVIPVIAGYTDTQSYDFADRLIEHLSSVPGVEAVAMGRRLPLSPFGGGAGVIVTIPGREIRPDSELPSIRYNVVGPGYFSTIGTRILRGRDFTATDRESAPGVVLVSAATARKFWPGSDPIGQHVRVGRPPGVDREIVGIVQDVKANTLTETIEPYLYLPFRQQPAAEMTFVLRVRRDPEAMLAEVRREVLAVDRTLPMMQVTTIGEHMHLALFTERMSAVLVGVLGGVGLLLAMIGLYAVVSYLVAHRTREIGVRMALGATRSQVVADVVKRGSVLAGCGIAFGLLGSWAASRLLGSQLYGVSAMDPLTLGAVSVGILLTTVMASYLPARRAARIDPISALRCE